MPTQSPVKKILNLLKLEKKEITAVYFYAILNGLIQLSLPVGVQAIIGFVLGASMRASLVVLIALVVTGVLVAGIMQINQMKIIEKIQQKIFVRYAFAFAVHIPRLDLKKNDNVYLPELVNRFFDIPILQKSLSKILLDVPTASIQILFGLILLSFYHPAFILFGFVLILLLWLILRYTGNHGLQSSIDESTFKYRVAGWLEEAARVFRSLKLAKNNDLHLQKCDEEVTDYLNARNLHFKILLFQYNVLVLFKTVITAAMLIVGTILLVNQQLNIGQFIAAEIIILLILNSVEKLIMTIGTVYDTLTSIEKISGFTEKPVEENGTTRLLPTQKGLKIEMKNLSFSYNDEKDNLANISLTINPGDKVCIQGKESSGKSTLLRVMAGAYTDFKGSLLIDDVPVGNYELDSVRSQIGVLINEQDIFNGTVWENIALGRDNISQQEVNDCAAKTGLTDFISTLKKGYDTILDPTGKRLPRNVVHKILLTRALVSKPRLLLLEDPWMNYGNGFRQQIIQILNDAENTTIVVVSNDDEFAKQCNKVIIMEEHSILSQHNNTV
jgi:ABC-type bacteriocin/lantibiotic exporter with double-glycine peptidase domain